MGIFRKESKTHFIRDEAGKVQYVTREGDKPREDKKPLFRDRSPVYRKLEQQHYKTHPKESPQYKRQQKVQRVTKVAKRIDHAVVNYNRRQPYKIQNNYNPFGTMFDTGMTRPKTKKPRTQTKYHISGEKAYPIAGTTKTKTKKRKTKRSSGYDPFNSSWGSW